MSDKTQQENDDMEAAKRWADKSVAAMVGDLPILSPMTQRLLDSCKRDRCDGYYAGILHERSKKVEPTESDEKQRRIYYQEIVYKICNLIDKFNGKKPGTGIVCGTLNSPSTCLQDEIERILADRSAISGSVEREMLREFVDYYFEHSSDDDLGHVLSDDQIIDKFLSGSSSRGE